MVKNIAGHKSSHGILPDHIQMGSCRVHVFLQSADTERLFFYGLQGIEETNTAFINNDQFVDRLCDLFNNVRGHYDDPGMTPKKTALAKPLF